jgi:hypothetical protein
MSENYDQGAGVEDTPQDEATPQDEDAERWERAAADVAQAPPLTQEQREVLAAAAEVSRERGR